MGQTLTTVTEQSGPLKTGDLQPEHVEYLSSKTHFQNREIVILAQKYKELAGSTENGGDGRIDREEFITKLNIRPPEIGDVMYKMLDTDGDHSIDFEEFVMGLDMFLPQSDLEARVKACFTAYNNNEESETGQDTLSKEELKRIISISLTDNKFVVMDEEQLEQLVDDLFAGFNKDHTGEMNYSEFRAMVLKAPQILDAFEFDMDSIMK